MSYQKSSYQASLVASLVKLFPSQQIDLLEGLYRHDALDLDTANENGLNLIEAMLDSTNATSGLIHFMDRIGRSDLYASPSSGVWHILDKQLLRWMPYHSNNNKECDEALALMISRADSGWWRKYDSEHDDEGSIVVSKLAKLDARSILSLRSLWDRGVDLHCRYGKDRTLAVSTIRREEILNSFIAAGGNLDLDIHEHKTPTIPLWRHLAQSSPKQLEPVILEIYRDKSTHVALLNNDRFLREVYSSKGNMAKMIKMLMEGTDWPHTKRLDGTPAWLWTLSLRRGALKAFLDKKRNPPVLTDQDPQGRSAWFWGLTNTDPNLETLDNLNHVLPANIYAKDAQGRGLITQLLEWAAQGPFSKDNTKWHNPLALLDWDGFRDRGDLLHGLDTIDLSALFFNAAVSDNYARPKPFYQLLVNPETRAALNPTQRGMCLCATTIFYKRLGETKQPEEWDGMRQAIWKDCERLGVVWPNMEALGTIINTMQLTSEKDLIDIASWKTGLERQRISEQTYPARGPSPGSRRI